MRIGKSAGWLATSLVLLSGCATFSLNAGFSEIGATVEERNAMKVVWNGGTELDKEAAEKVQSLLKDQLSADAAVQIALLNNRRLQAVYSDLGVAQADLVQAGLLRNPIFHAAVLFLQKGGRPELEAGADMNFLEIFYLPLRKRVAEARFEEAKLKVTGAVLDFAGQVRSSFYVHQANEQMLELRQRIVQALSLSLDIARRLHEAGNINDLDLARERALTEASKVALRSAELAVRQSREQMNSLMGLWGKDTEWTIDIRLPDIPGQPMQVDGFERVALSRSVDLAHAKQGILVTGEQLGFNRTTALLPEIDFGVHGEREEGSWQIGPEIALPFPLFDQGQARIGRALAELRRAQQEYYAVAIDIRSAARAAQDRAQAARDRALYYRDILLPLHERIVNESQLQYNAMQLGPIELLRARERQIETAVAYIETLRDYWLARADISQIMSGRLPGFNGMKAGQAGGQIKRNDSEGH